MTSPRSQDTKLCQQAFTLKRRLHVEITANCRVFFACFLTDAPTKSKPVSHHPHSAVRNTCKYHSQLQTFNSVVIKSGENQGLFYAPIAS
jgi:hypothetical protein